jgi:hypothetical protein
MDCDEPSSIGRKANSTRHLRNNATTEINVVEGGLQAAVVLRRAIR